MANTVSCRICEKELASRKELERHLMLDHSVTLKDYYGSHPEATKRCSKCHRELPIAKFYVDRSTRSGHRTRCIECFRPGGETRECPVCYRIFRPSGVITHLKRVHGIKPLVAFRKYLGGKYCPKCKTTKPLRKFYRVRQGGYSPYCRECNAARQREYRLRKA